MLSSIFNRSSKIRLQKQGKRSRYRADIAFLDMIFNMLMRVAFLLVVYLIIAQIDQKNKDAESPPEKVDMLVQFEWDDDTYVDMDLWTRGPTGTIIFYNARQGGLMSLDRDDRGNATDTQIVNGKVVGTHFRKEVLVVHNILAGEYVFNGYYYSRNDLTPIVHAKITIFLFSPTMTQVYQATHEFTQPGQEFTYVHLFFDEHKNLLRTETEPFVQLNTSVGSDSHTGGTSGTTTGEGVLR
jgi:hypothetical protein